MFSQENNEIIHPEIRELDLTSPLKDRLFSATALSCRDTAQLYFPWRTQTQAYGLHWVLSTKKAELEDA